ncbi:MAG TPA: hypothetical protein VJY41_07345 [Prolixibacteraceae bacterium]|nr:hypothetical protein [Prolixibacteraceae bacterium]
MDVLFYTLTKKHWLRRFKGAYGLLFRTTGMCCFPMLGTGWFSLRSNDSGIGGVNMFP